MALEVDTRDWSLRTARNEEEMWALADEQGVHDARLSYPSGWLFLTRDAATRDLVAAATEATDERAAAAYADDLDHDADRVERALDDLVALGAFHADGDGYRPNPDSVVVRSVDRLDAAVRNAAESTDAAGTGAGFRDLARSEAVRLMLDALLYADDERVSQADLHEWCGLARKQVWMHVDRLEEYGVLVAAGDDYAIGEESSVFGGVRALDAAVVGAALSP